MILRRGHVHVVTDSWLVYPVLMQLLHFFYIYKSAEECLAQCYSVVVYNKIYDHCMMPMNGVDLWPEDIRRPKPPTYVKMPGRPRKERRREHGEAKKATKVSKIGTKIKCSKCHQEGHNSRTCGPKSNAKRRIFEAGKEASICDAEKNFFRTCLFHC